MQELCAPYRSYLSSIRRYSADAVETCMSVLPSVWRDLHVSSVDEINRSRVMQAWRCLRWASTDYGIQLSESENAAYILALKELLRYLELSGHPVDRGLADIVQLPNHYRVPLGGLTPQEQGRLHQFLLFHVGSERNRREAALMFLMLGSDLSLDEALPLKVHTDGVIQQGGSGNWSSGNFVCEDGAITIRVPGARGTYRNVALSKEALIFVQFHLENRKLKSPTLFARSSGKSPGAAIRKVAATNALENILRAAQVTLDREMIEPVLRMTVSAGAHGRVSHAATRALASQVRTTASEVALKFPQNQDAA